MADLPQHDVLKTSFDDGWLTVSMDDPARKNALSAEMSKALSETLRAVEDDRSVRGITLRGEGGVFCSGGDLKSFGRQIMAGARDEIEAMSRDGAELFSQMAHQPQPVVALVEGPAMAGGLGMVCCADIVAVTEDATFALTEVRLGIPPAQIAPFVVGRLGLVTAKRLMLTGARFDGREAGRLGLADHVAADAEGLLAYEREVRREVLACAPGAVAATKDLALASVYLPPDEMNARAATAFTDCLLSDEGREGIASFMEKRKPRWAERTDG